MMQPSSSKLADQQATFSKEGPRCRRANQEVHHRGEWDDRLHPLRLIYSWHSHSTLPSLLVWGQTSGPQHNKD